MRAIWVIIVFIFITVIDIPAMLKEKEHRARYIFINSFFILTGLTVSILQVIGQTPVSPAKVIEIIIKSII